MIAKWHMKRCALLLIIRGIQIKTTKRYHLRPITMAIIKKTMNSKYWQGNREKETLIHFCWEFELVQSPWKTSWSFLKRIKIELAFDPVFYLRIPI